MTAQQRATVLISIHGLSNNERHNLLDQRLLLCGFSGAELQSQVERVEDLCDNGIGNLNTNQLNNILSLMQQSQEAFDSVQKRLEFYGIDSDYHQTILDFCRDYVQAQQTVEVAELDSKFKGVQVASRDDFNAIMNKGWTGDWDLNPKNIEILRVQVASMNDEGAYPRGCYLTADIARIEPIPHNSRYRLHIVNPTIYDTGNRNVKFTANPVRYVR